MKQIEYYKIPLSDFELELTDANPKDQVQLTIFKRVILKHITQIGLLSQRETMGNNMQSKIIEHQSILKRVSTTVSKLKDYEEERCVCNMKQIQLQLAENTFKKTLCKAGNDQLTEAIQKIAIQIHPNKEAQETTMESYHQLFKANIKHSDEYSVLIETVEENIVVFKEMLYLEYSKEKLADKKELLKTLICANEKTLKSMENDNAEIKSQTFTEKCAELYDILSDKRLCQTMSQQKDFIDCFKVQPAHNTWYHEENAEALYNMEQASIKLHNYICKIITDDAKRLVCSSPEKLPENINSDDQTEKMAPLINDYIEAEKSISEKLIEAMKAIDLLRVLALVNEHRERYILPNATRKDCDVRSSSKDTMLEKEQKVIDTLHSQWWDFQNIKEKKQTDFAELHEELSTTSKFKEELEAVPEHEKARVDAIEAKIKRCDDRTIKLNTSCTIILRDYDAMDTLLSLHNNHTAEFSEEMLDVIYKNFHGARKDLIAIETICIRANMIYATDALEIQHTDSDSDSDSDLDLDSDSDSNHNADELNNKTKALLRNTSFLLIPAPHLKTLEKFLSIINFLTDKKNMGLTALREQNFKDRMIRSKSSFFK